MLIIGEVIIKLFGILKFNDFVTNCLDTGSLIVAMASLFRNTLEVIEKLIPVMRKFVSIWDKDFSKTLISFYLLYW